MKTQISKKVHSRKLLLFFFDFVCLVGIAAAYFLLHLWLTNGAFNESARNIYSSDRCWFDVALLAGCVLGARLLFRVYSNVCRYADTTVYLTMVASDAVGGLLAMLLSFVIFGTFIFWFFVTVAALNALLALSSRFVYRLCYRNLHRSVGTRGTLIPVAIIGAGSAGAALLKELRYKKAGTYQPMFFIDIDQDKVGSRVLGLKVYGQIRRF